MDGECPVSQTMDHVLAWHHHAWACFGGLPKTIMVDTLPSAVLQRVLGEAPGCQPQSLDCATPCGFPIAPCHVGKGKEKGRVANGVGSGKKPVRAGRALPDCRARHPAARQGLATGANGRRHRATREQPTV